MGPQRVRGLELLLAEGALVGLGLRVPVAHVVQEAGGAVTGQVAVRALEGVYVLADVFPQEALVGEALVAVGAGEAWVG